MTGTTTPQLAAGHVGINVTDLDRSVAFYRNALGFEPLAVNSEGEHRYAFLGTGGTLRPTLWQQSNGRFSTETPGLHHLSFEAASIDEVRTVEAALKALGTEFAHDGVVAHGEEPHPAVSSSQTRTEPGSRCTRPTGRRPLRTNRSGPHLRILLS